VLTRLPPPGRRGPAVVARLLQQNFPGTRFLSGETAAALFGRLAAVGIDGGAVYDALVGAAALQHGLPLLTRDRRAADTYRRLAVTFHLIG
jgi:predicted nucleic acid-binding protein